MVRSSTIAAQRMRTSLSFLQKNTTGRRSEAYILRAERPLATLHEIFERARAAQQRIPPGESAWLLAAVVRIAAARNTTLRSRLVQLDANRNVSVLPFTDSRRDEGPSYHPPQLVRPRAPPLAEPSGPGYC